MEAGGLRENAIVALLESAPDGVLLVDPDGTIVFANETAGRLFGYPGEDLVGLKVEALVPERLRRRHARERRAYSKEPRRRPIGLGLELVGLRRDGSELPLEIALSPMPWQEGVATVAFVRDASERRLLELERIRRARSEAVEEIVSGLEAIVWEATGPDRASLTYLGGRQDAFLGYPRESWLKEGFWLSVVHPEDRAAALAFAEAAREQETFDLEYRLIAASGDVRHVRDIVAVSHREDGEIERLRGVIVDVTEQRLLEEQLAQAQKMEAIGQLAGGIAHDFNNLLTIASGHARRLARRPELASARNELGQILTATDRAAELTRQLLAFARRSPEEVARVDPNETARALQPMLRTLIDEDIAFDLELDDAAPPILIDRSHLEQILMNLILNARDAMPTGGLLRVTSASATLGQKEAGKRGIRPGSYLMLRVADTGEGVAEEVKTRIFEPFFTTKAGKGTGLGLATVYGLTERAGGYVEVESTPGHGATFTVALPAAPPVAGPGKREPPAPAAGPTVLLVEDEPGLRELAKIVLMDEGYLVLEAGTGREAIAVAERHRGEIDLLVTDVIMPGVSGPELAQHLRRLQADLEVLFMSGYSDSRLLNHGIEEAQMNLIVKPFSPDELVRRVGELTSGSR